MLELHYESLRLRLVEPSDAAFIMQLRTDARNQRFISETSLEVSSQLKWIEDYKKREALREEYYFLAEYEGEPVGTLRIYKISSESFVSGSWVFRPDTKGNSAVVAHLLVRMFGFEVLGKNENLFSVSKGNKSVLSYHRIFSPELIDENEIEYSYRLKRDAFYSRLGPLCSALGIEMPNSINELLVNV